MAAADADAARPAADAGAEEAPPAKRPRGPLDRFLRPRPRPQQQLVPQAALRSAHLAHQLLAAELGWPVTGSGRAWLAATSGRGAAQLALPPVRQQALLNQRQPVACLELQRGGDGLAAVGFAGGTLHLLRRAELARAAAAACDPGGGGLACVAVAAAAVWTLDLQARLLSADWAHGGELAELATAGPRGVQVRRFVEGRHHAAALALKSGRPAEGAACVRYLPRGAAYTLAAARPGGLALWDCRAASRAVAELPTSGALAHLAPLPGGELLLGGCGDGQVALYDVRRHAGSASSVVNFGGGRDAAALVARYNLPMRAAAAAGGAGAAAPLFPFLSALCVSPGDANLVAYARPDLQVGVLDLAHNRVVAQACVAEALGGGDAAMLAGCQQRAAARCCWDGMGRVLYTHGLLRQGQPDGAASLSPTLAAVDFGSCVGQEQRRGGAWLRRDDAGGGSGAVEAAADTAREHDQGACGGGAAAGGVLSADRQVWHLAMPAHAVPTELAVGAGGELLLGTLQGDLVCVR
ncbi:hypothetical protein HT031_000007 [Scenedesmus sp. PABB004]|nr:hypothetical protein HT031_000007 [Scenedesmus sp. PABB004]